MNDSEVPAGWQWARIGDVLDETQYGLNLLAAPEGNMPIVGMKDLMDGRVSDANLACVTISKVGAARYLLREGDILLNRTNSADLVGKIGYVDGSLHAVFASYLVRLKPNRSLINPKFLAFWLSSPKGQEEIRPLVTRGVSQANINPTAFCRHVAVPLPPLSEQGRIADILATWDRALDHLRHQIARKRDLFTSLRDALVHGTRHLAGHQGRKSNAALGTFLHPIKRAVPKPTEPYLALSLRSHGKGTFQRLVDRPENIDMDTLYRVGSRDLIVNITFAWEGAIALAKAQDEGCLVSHRFPTFEIDETQADRDFLGYAVNDKRFFYYLGIASPGGAGRNRVLNQRDFLDLEIPFPPMGEQNAIAKILIDAEREIVALDTERTALEKQRDALAAELLTGRLRVPEAEQLAAVAG